MDPIPDPNEQREVAPVEAGRFGSFEARSAGPNSERDSFVAAAARVRELLGIAREMESKNAKLLLDHEHLFSAFSRYTNAIQTYAKRESETRNVLCTRVTTAMSALLKIRNELAAVVSELGGPVQLHDAHEDSCVDEGTVHGQYKRAQALVDCLTVSCKSIEELFFQAKVGEPGLFQFSELVGGALEPCSARFLRGKADLERVGELLKTSQRLITTIGTLQAQVERDQGALQKDCEQLFENRAQQLALKIESTEVANALECEYSSLRESAKGLHASLIDTVKRVLGDSQVMERSPLNLGESVRELGKRLLAVSPNPTEAALDELTQIYLEMLSAMTCLDPSARGEVSSGSHNLQVSLDTEALSRGAQSGQGEGVTSRALVRRELLIRKFSLHGADFDFVARVERVLFGSDQNEQQLRSYCSEPGRQLWGAFLGGTIVGYVIWQWAENGSSEIQSLYVTPECQCQGTGSALIEEVAKFSGVESVTLVSSEFDTELALFLRNRGFRATPLRGKYGERGDGYAWRRPSRVVSV